MAKPRYTPEHAAAGLDAKFPEIETWPNQFPGYEIVIDDPEFTSVCPKTGLPDFGVLTIRYMPDRRCLELKSLKEYLHRYRNLGIFQENIVNCVLRDVVRWAKPVWAEVKGDFRPRGGISTTVAPPSHGRRCSTGTERRGAGRRHILTNFRKIGVLSPRQSRSENAVVVISASAACRESRRVCCTTTGTSESITRANGIGAGSSRSLNRTWRVRRHYRVFGEIGHGRGHITPARRLTRIMPVNNPVSASTCDTKRR